MFESEKPRYLTSNVDAEIPLELQLYLWHCVDQLPKPRDYLQVFVLQNVDGLQCITHHSEQPAYRMEHILPGMQHPVSNKVYIIDSGDYCTMLLASDY